MVKRLNIFLSALLILSFVVQNSIAFASGGSLWFFGWTPDGSGNWNQDVNTGGNIIFNKPGTFVQNTATTVSGTAAGSSIGDATVLQQSISRGTATLATQGFVLPNVPIGGFMLISNPGTVPFNVYPTDSGTGFLGLGNGVPLAVGQNQTLFVYRWVATRYLGLLGGGSANPTTSDITGLFMQAGSTFQTAKGGANATAGTFTCNGVTAVTITTTNASVNMILTFSPTVLSGTAPIGAPYVSAITAGTSFQVKCSVVGETSGYNWAMMAVR